MSMTISFNIDLSDLALDLTFEPKHQDKTYEKWWVKNSLKNINIMIDRCRSKMSQITQKMGQMNAMLDRAETAGLKVDRDAAIAQQNKIMTDVRQTMLGLQAAAVTYKKRYDSL
jgi:hypothetical protein